MASSTAGYEDEGDGRVSIHGPGGRADNAERQGACDPGGMCQWWELRSKAARVPGASREGVSEEAGSSESTTGLTRPAERSQHLAQSTAQRRCTHPPAG